MRYFVEISEKDVALLWYDYTWAGEHRSNLSVPNILALALQDRAARVVNVISSEKALQLFKAGVLK